MNKYVGTMIICMLATDAGAQTVYKCTAGGKVSYGDQPCADGRTTTLAAPAAPGDAKAAPEELARVRAHLARLQKERAVAEAREARANAELARASRAAATVRQKCERLRLKVQWAQQDVARAGGNASEAMHLKAKRQAEAMAVECPG